MILSKQQNAAFDGHQTLNTQTRKLPNTRFIRNLFAHIAYFC